MLVAAAAAGNEPDEVYLDLQEEILLEIVGVLVVGRPQAGWPHFHTWDWDGIAHSGVGTVQQPQAGGSFEAADSPAAAAAVVVVELEIAGFVVGTAVAFEEEIALDFEEETAVGSEEGTAVGFEEGAAVAFEEETVLDFEEEIVVDFEEETAVASEEETAEGFEEGIAVVESDKGLVVEDLVVGTALAEAEMAVVSAERRLVVVVAVGGHNHFDWVAVAVVVGIDHVGFGHHSSMEEHRRQCQALVDTQIVDLVTPPPPPPFEVGHEHHPGILLLGLPLAYVPL